ncbi:hypothetical protein D9615_006796 [Tricholomella constricta]|uniref:Uncharacterized protein n=1 Tax=Tricholomella constricta TaxID=117010 RepID=A0A8H5H768_9AGAR|nr:hypothetical protein D9615_006796 [Tricholomella constricta]
MSTTIVSVDRVNFLAFHISATSRQRYHANPDSVFARNTTSEDASPASQIRATQEIPIERFRQRMMDLRGELGNFSKECRQLGRSYALITAVRELIETLDRMLTMFHENAAKLSKMVQEPLKNQNRIATTFAGLSAITTRIDGVADAFENFRERLNEFREYTDESVKLKSIIKLFEGDLRYRTSCLKAYRGRFDHDHVNMHLFVNNLMEEMGDDLDEILSAFKFFNTYGVPAMHYEQKRDAEIVLNLSTVATFFSAVTATTLQMSVSIQGEGTRPSRVIAIVNTFWFCSLVLSIGAALNSLMAAAWKRTTYGTRGRKLPLWVTIWIHVSAPIFLLVSIACFSAGLVLFSYGSNQEKTTSVLTLVTTIVTSFGFIAVATWIVYEQWIAALILTFPSFRDRLQSTPPIDNATETKETTHASMAGHVSFRRKRSDSISVISVASTASNNSSFGIADLVHIFGRKPLEHADAADKPLDPESLAHPPSAEASLTAGEHDGQHRPINPLMGWSTAARTVALETTAAKEFWKKTTHAIPRWATSNAKTESPQRTASPIPRHQMTLESTHLTLHSGLGVIQDLEYSPDGKILATAQ